MNFSKKRKKCLAIFFAATIVFETFAPSIARAEGDGKPLSSSLEGMVDPFTGDFRYGIPLMTIPGPNGENYPISASYLSGISVNQEASWIGLGWDFNPGEINRTISGVPDDIKEGLVLRESMYYGSYYGPLYYKNFDHSKRFTSTSPNSSANPTAAMDITGSNLNNGVLFEYPAYDKYFAVSPDFFSELKLRLFDYKTLYHWNHQQINYGGKNFFDETTYSIGQGNTITRLNEFQKRPQFSFGEEWGAKTRLGAITYPWDNNSYVNHFTSATPDLSTRSHSANFVEYFTNTEINNIPEGFLNYNPISTGIVRPALDFPPDGIGAFRVTTPSGMTYHYSLPVYSKNENRVKLKLNESFDFVSSDNEADYFTYAKSWKLTAVTGPGYVDKNGNHFADSGDEGYWISLSYGKWTNNYKWRSPFYGFNLDKQTGRFLNNMSADDYNTKYLRQGSYSTGEEEIYYLNSIKTASHTAYFIKDLRQDEHSRKNSSAIVTPKLRLDRIILLRNEDDQGYLNPNNVDAFTEGSFNFSGSGVAKSTVTHIGNYNAHKQAIDNASLKTVVFKTDQSLCKKTYNNINNIYSVNSQMLHEHDASFTSSNGLGGKLTLKSIESYEKGGVSISPPYKFEYALNPDFAHDKTDIWGNYKSDFDYTERGQYTTTTSKLSLHAWSLTKITIPTGAEIEVNYESDSYSRVGHTNSFPHKFFFIKNYNYATGEFSFNDKNALHFLSENVKMYNFSIPLITQFSQGCECVGGLYTISDTLTYPESTPGAGAGVYSLDFDTYMVNFVGSVNTDGCNTGTCTTRTYQPTIPGYLDLYSTIAYGGGIRVKEISIKEKQSNKTYKNVYEYEGGVATGEPDRFGSPILYSSYESDPGSLPPSIGYSKVKVRAVANFDSEGYKEFDFFNYKYERSQSSTTTIGAETEDRSEVYQNNSLYGKLKTEKIFNINSQLIYSLENDYSTGYTFEDNTPYQNVLTEAFHSHTKDITNPAGPKTETSVYIKKEYQLTLLSQKIFKNGVTSLVEYDSFDPYTGNPLKTVLTDQSTGVTETLLTPAHSIYPAIGSKLINITNRNILIPFSKTLLNKGYSTSTTLLRFGRIDQVDLVGGSTHQWTNTLTYRKFDPSLLKYSSVSEIDNNYWATDLKRIYNNNPDESQWRNINEITLLDKKTKKVLEEHSGLRYSAVKLGYKKQYKIAEASDCNYNSFGFSSFEDTLIHRTGSGDKIFFGGEITGGAYRNPGDLVIKPHSGFYLAKVPQGTQGPTFYSEVNNTDSGIGLKEKGLQCGRTYRASVWMHETNIASSALVAKLIGTSASQGSINLQVSTPISDTKNIKVNNWVLVNLNITVPNDMTNSSSLEVYATGGTTSTGLFYYLDDFSIEPLDAGVSKYVYDPATGWLKANLDKENFATFYNHDAGGRIISVSKETAAGIKKVSENAYKISQ